MLEKKITFDSFIRGIISALIIIGILYLVNYLSSVLLPFFVAWLIAYMTYPMVTFVQYKLKVPWRFSTSPWGFCAAVFWGSSRLAASVEHC